MKQDSGRLILISGLPGSGKTTCGRWLSDKYKIPYVDYDGVIQQMCIRDRCISVCVNISAVKNSKAILLTIPLS